MYISFPIFTHILPYHNFQTSFLFNFKLSHPGCTITPPCFHLCFSSDWEYFNQTFKQRNKVAYSLSQDSFTLPHSMYHAMIYVLTDLFWFSITGFHCDYSACTSWFTCWSPQFYSLIKLGDQRLNTYVCGIHSFVYQVPSKLPAHVREVLSFW